jgi:hypothetical protein
MDKSFAIARSDFGAVGNSDKVCMPVISKPGVEVFPWSDE